MYQKFRQHVKNWLLTKPTTVQKQFVDFYELEPCVLFSATPVDAEILDVDLENFDLDLTEITIPANEIVSPLDNVEQLLSSLEQLDSDYLDDSSDFRRELVFITSDVEDSETLLAGVSEHAEVITISSDENGLQRMTEILADRSGLTSLHIVAHGSDGVISLGTSQLQLDTFQQHLSSLQSWQTAFAADADILIYGCDVAQSDNGQELIDLIAEATQVGVAASNDVTGAEELGGDWDLEYHSGTVESELAFSLASRSEWLGTLATYTVTSADDSGAGTLRWAIDQANANSGHDTINFSIPVITAETINLLSTLEITDSVTIDATTQTGYVGQPMIELNGTGIINREIMLLDVGSGGSVIRGFAFINSSDEGLLIESDGNTIQSNYFGVESDGATAAANNGGLRVRSDNNTIGGSDSEDRNIFSGNTNYGLRLSSSASENYVQGNFVGLSLDGDPLGNANRGILLSGSSHDNFIGGTGAGEGNTIAYNATDGITLSTSGNGNSIRGNLIFDNAGDENDLPIDLNSDGPDSNDIGLFSADGDGGANDSQNFPELYSARYDGYTLTVRGRQTGPSNEDIDLDFYAGSGLLGNGYGNARQYLGSEVSRTGGTGQDYFTIQLTGLVIDPSSYLSVTATNEDGSTSEFSEAIEIVDLRSSLLFATGGDVSGSGTPGETEWSEEDVLEFRGDDWGAGQTSGRVENFADMGRFEFSDFGLDGIHFVGSSLTIGSGGNAVDLQYGDLLLTIDESTTFYGTFNALSVDNDDVFFFRPDSIDSYFSGKFFMLFDSPTGNEINAITLVENESGITLADGTHLQQGTLLFSDEGGGSADVSMFVANSAGETTSGTATLLLDGSDNNLDFDEDINGLAIVEEDKNMGGVDLELGDLLITFDENDEGGKGGIGSNGLDLKENDVAAIRIANTEVGSGNSSGIATMLFDGSVIGLNGNSEELSAISFATSTSNVAATANLEPTDINLSNTVMAENTDSSLGQPVGTLTTVDGDSDTFTYEIVTSYGDASLFSIGGVDSDQLILTDTNLPDGILDFETKPTYDVRVRSTDISGLSTVQNFVITITDNNDAPVIAAQSFNVDENTTAVGAVAANDQDNDSLYYSIANTTGDNALFSINSGTGVLAFINPPNFETPYDNDSDNAYEVDIVVNDGTTTATEVVTVTVNDVNEAPVSNGAYPDIFAMTTSAPEVIDLSTLFLDPDFDDSLSFNAISSDASVVTATVAGDELTLTFSTEGSATITIEATDPHGETATTTIDVLVSPNRPPSIETSRLDVLENSPAGTVVGTVVASIGEPDSILTYNITGGSGAAHFAIDSTTGVVTVVDPSVLDHETNSGFGLRVEVTDDNGLSDTERVRIRILDVNEAPTAIGIPDQFVREDARQFNIVLSDHFDDVDDGDELTYTLVGNSNPRLGSIEIVGDQIRVAPNPDAFGTTTLTVRGTDGDGESVQTSFDVNVAAVNDAPEAVGERFIVESGETLRASDLLANDSDVEADVLTAILVDGPDNGALTLNPDGSFSYIPDPLFAGKDTFTYRVSDGDLESEPVSVVVDVVVGGFAPTIAPPPEPPTNEDRESDYEEENDYETETITDVIEELTNTTNNQREQNAGSDVVQGEAHQFKFGSEKSGERNSSLLLDGTAGNEQTFISILRPDNTQNTESINEKLAASMDKISLRTTSSDDVVNSPWLWEALNDYNSQVETESNLPRILIGGTAGIASGISVGYLIWLVRGGQILAAVMANLPAWSLIDPLPVLSRLQPDDGVGEGDSLQAIIEKSETQLDNATNPTPEAATPTAE